MIGKKGFKIFFLKIFILFLSLSPNVSHGSEGTPETANKAQVDREILQGIELLYSMKFNEGEDLFYKVIAKKPEDPMGYFYLAMASWSRMSDGFWSPEVVKQYGERIDKAISVARDKIERGKADSFTYFYLGAALGFKGRFRLIQHRWLSSFFIALEAIDSLKTCQKMDPDNRDVLSGLGMYDYYTDRLSGVLRFLSFLFLYKGDKQEGLRKLHVAAEEAIYSSIEAKSMLLHIYLFLESDFHKALPFAKDLAERFQSDPGYRSLEGVTYIQLDMDSKYQEVVDLFRQKSQSERSSSIAYIWANRGLYLEASYYLFHDQYVKARSRLEDVLAHTDPEKDPLMTVWPLLKIGMSYDLEGEREKALAYYNRILDMENGAGAQFLAEKYIAEPIEKGDPFLGL
ncbi:MAG: hypothetical protein JRC68_01760 [Deltaproteobacteria bacterium]|nr:hypothetical protein [Deltaproteobacteria bacterium]